MLKWITGCLVLVGVCIVLAVWGGVRKYKSVTAQGDTTSVVIHAPSARVFASMAHGDSLRTWLTTDDSVEVFNHGPLAVGDSIRVRSTRPVRERKNGKTVREMLWTITEVKPNTVIATSLRADTDSTELSLSTRRDSLVDMGDSTMIVTRVGSGLMESIRGKTDTAGKAVAGMLDMTHKLLIVAMRTEAKMELDRLKRHIEGTRRQ